MPTDYGDFDLHSYPSKLMGSHHLALVERQRISPNKPRWCEAQRMPHGDVFGSARCDCGNQLHAALRQISRSVMLTSFLPCAEGRWDCWQPKSHAYKLQEEGLDTVEAKRQSLAFRWICAIMELGAQILFDLGCATFRFLTNNPKKVIGLERLRNQMIEQVPIPQPGQSAQQKNLETKKQKMGHLL